MHDAHITYAWEVHNILCMGLKLLTLRDEYWIAMQIKLFLVLNFYSVFMLADFINAVYFI